MAIIKDGSAGGKLLNFDKETIRNEASQDGLTSFVIATCDDGTEISISQHNSGDWDVCVDGEAGQDDFNEDEFDLAWDRFCQWIQLHSED